MFKGVILCDKRTGSTFLQNCLDSHPDITCYDELFMIRTGLKKRHGQFMYRHMMNTKKWSKNNFINYLGEQNKNVFFKLIYDQCDFWKLDKIIKKENFKIIHLLRNNHLKKAISGLTKKQFQVKKLDITPEDLLNRTLKSLKKTNMYIKKWKDYDKQIFINYEDMIGKKEGEIKKIKKVGAFNMKSKQITYLNEEICKKLCDFIDVEYFPMHCNITKKNSDNLWDYIKDEDKKKLRKLFKKNNINRILDI